MLVNSFSGAIGMWVLLNLFRPQSSFLLLFFVFVLRSCSLSQSVRYKFKSLKPYSIIIPYSLLSLLEI